MTVSERARYEAMIVRYKASKCRMDREYASYLDRWFHSHETVDGQSYEMRMRNDKAEPMPYNAYWIE